MEAEVVETLLELTATEVMVGAAEPESKSLFQRTLCRIRYIASLVLEVQAEGLAETAAAEEIQVPARLMKESSARPEAIPQSPRIRQILRRLE